jgi:hypothetical protein
MKRKSVALDTPASRSPERDRRGVVGVRGVVSAFRFSA